jgi:hypothetical protein
MSRSASLSRGGRCERGFRRCPIWDKASLTRLINRNPNDIVADMEPDARRGHAACGDRRSMACRCRKTVVKPQRRAAIARMVGA